MEDVSSSFTSSSGDLGLSPSSSSELTLSVFGNSDSSFAGSISGTGGLLKQGRLLLSGENTFTGATQISGGVLQVSNPSALSGTSEVILEGGTLQASTDLILNSGQNIRVGDSVAGVLNVDSATTTTVNGVISDLTSQQSGSLVKQGEGTLILNGENTYSGTTTVSAGKLDPGSLDGFGDGEIRVDGGPFFSQTTKLTPLTRWFCLLKVEPLR